MIGICSCLAGCVETRYLLICYETETLTVRLFCPKGSATLPPPRWSSTSPRSLAYYYNLEREKHYHV